MRFKSVLFLSLLTFTFGCKERKPLPILGEKMMLNGKEVNHQIPDFSFINQDSVAVTQKDFEGKIYVADFFFTSCPTICPVMKTQMLRIYERFKTNSDVKLLSHSIDPTHDTPANLRTYVTRLGVNTPQWQFVTGDRKKLFEIGEKAYMVTTKADSTVEGGLLHSGAFLLVDKKRQIRGQYDGTKAAEVDQLMEDMALLLEEK